jgi:hypothetical protein
MRSSRVWTACASAIVAGAVLSLMWPGGASSQVVIPGWRCYPAKDLKGTPKFAATDVLLNGTLQGSVATAVKPAFYCDPVNSQVINGTQTIRALACYKIKDLKGTPKFPGAQVSIGSPIGDQNETLDLKTSKLFCVPVL